MESTQDASADAMLGLLNKVPFFDRFSVYEKKRLSAAHTGFQKIRAGVMFIKEGEMDSSFYILLSGRVAVSKKGAELGHMEEGEFFGEMAFLGDTVRTTSVIARNNVYVLRIDKVLIGLLSCDIREKIKDQCILKLVERVDKLTERLRVRL